MGPVGEGARGADDGHRHPGLDGLRGLAIVAVVVFHGGVGFAGGALGVDLFLVLSGYLITTLLVRELRGSGRVDLGGFWVRRLRRLLPALLVVVTVVAVHGALVGGGDPAALRGDALATLGYVANWRFALADGGYFAAFGAPSPLRHAWSLAVEEQWYLLWPPALWGLWRLLGRRPALLTAALLALAGASAGLMARWADDLDRVHYGTDTRAQGLLVGAALAVWLHHRPVGSWVAASRRRAALAAAPALVLVLVAFVVAGGTEPWLYRGGHLAFAGLSAVVLLGALLPGPVRRGLSLRPLRWLGAVSYGLYLWHWPIFVWLTPSNVGLDRWPLFAVRVAVSLGLAVASARWVERPFRRRHARPLPRPGLAALAATGVVALVVAGSLSVATPDEPTTALAARPELPEGFDLEAATAAAAVSARTPTTPPPPTGLPPATPAPPDGVVSVAVVGDSTGWTLAWENPPLAGVRITNGSLLGCGIDPAPIVVADAAVVVEGDPVPCGAPAEALWHAGITRAAPDVVLLTMGAWEVFDRWPEGGQRLDVGTPAWSTWMGASLERVTGALVQWAPQAVIAITDVPCFDEREDWLGGPTSPRNDPARVGAVNEVLRSFAAANPDRIAVVPMASWVCPGGVPLAEVDGVTLRPDGVHVADEGAALLWERQLAPAVRALVPAP
jgi:peptidoglycan/LPS O-acetylase OafA/YrhL